MILGIDTAMATCGYAVVRARPYELVEFGVLDTERDPSIDRGTDRARRIAAVGEQLQVIRDRHGVTLIAAEALLGHGTVHAVIPQALCWGMLVQLAVEADIDMATVTAKEWQHAVMPERAGKKIDYPALKKELETFVGPRLLRVPPALRTHALDAVGIATYAAFNAVTLVRRGKARRAAHVEASV